MFGEKKIKIKVVDVEKENKRREIKQKVVDSVDKVIHLAAEHPEATITIATTAATVIGYTVKTAYSKKVIKLHERDVYDHSIGAYLTAKRPLNNNDIGAISALMKNEGLTKYQAMKNLNLL